MALLGMLGKGIQSGFQLWGTLDTNKSNVERSYNDLLATQDNNDAKEHNSDNDVDIATLRAKSKEKQAELSAEEAEDRAQLKTLNTLAEGIEKAETPEEREAAVDAFNSFNNYYIQDEKAEDAERNGSAEQDIETNSESSETNAAFAGAYEQYENTPLLYTPLQAESSEADTLISGFNEQVDNAVDYYQSQQIQQAAEN